MRSYQLLLPFSLKTMAQPGCPRWTAFQHFLMDEHEREPSAGGLASAARGRKWQSLPKEDKEHYKARAQQKPFMPKLCLKQLRKCISSFCNHYAETVSAGITSVCFAVLRNGEFEVDGFGPLYTAVQTKDIYTRLHAAGVMNVPEEKSCAEDLRKQLKMKMTNISVRDVNLKKFPYTKVEKGEFIVDGVPPGIVLKAPAYLSRGECQKLLDAEIRIFRVMERKTAIADAEADTFVPLREPVRTDDTVVDPQHLASDEIKVLHNIPVAVKQDTHSQAISAAAITQLGCVMETFIPLSEPFTFNMVSPEQPANDHEVHEDIQVTLKHEDQPQTTPLAATEGQTLPLQQQNDRPPGKENCTICGKGFAYKSLLVRHYTSHTGEKNFYCDVCGKSFSQKATLKKHLKLHT